MSYITICTYLSNCVIHFFRNTGMPAMASRRSDAIAGIPVFLHSPGFCCPHRKMLRAITNLIFLDNVTKKVVPSTKNTSLVIVITLFLSTSSDQVTAT